MSDLVVALLFAIGLGTWVYVKISHRSNSSTPSLISAIFVGIIAFIVVITFLKSILHV